MNNLKIVVLLAIMVIISIPPVFAQISIGEPAEQLSIEISISEDGDVHVEHLVKKSETIIQVDTISGTVSNLKATNVNNEQIQYAVSGDNSGVTIFPTKENVIIEYDLDDVLTQVEGVWMWNFRYIASPTFIFPDGVDLVFANDRPVHIKDTEGMRCHGCQMTLEYIINEPTIMKQVEWENQKFQVYFRTLAEISSFNFDQPSKRITFELNEENRFVTMIIPLKLLWNPYEVYLDDERIFKHEFSQNSTHVWLNVKPKDGGTISVIGISAIPEFPLLIPLVLGMAMALGIQFRNKSSLR